MHKVSKSKRIDHQVLLFLFFKSDGHVLELAAIRQEPFENFETYFWGPLFLFCVFILAFSHNLQD